MVSMYVGKFGVGVNQIRRYWIVGGGIKLGAHKYVLDPFSAFAVGLISHFRPSIFG